MPLSLISKLRPRLFGKFLLLLIGAAILISLLLGLYWRRVVQPQIRNDWHAQIDYYQARIADDLGDPPDASKAQRLADRLHLGFRFESKNTGIDSWQTNYFPEKYSLQNAGRVRHGEYIGSVLIASGRLLFYYRMRAEVERIHAVAMISIVVCVLFLAWLISRRLLRPVRLLNSGMAAIEAGALDSRVEHRGDDELSELTRNFNRMVSHIETMVADRDRLLADVSHELRSPLTRLKLALELIKERKTTKPLRLEIAAMESIITAILDTERMAATDGRETFDVVGVANSVCRAYDIRLQTQIANMDIYGNAEKLKIALRNVVENARLHGARPIFVSLAVDERHITLAIVDSGAGIAAAERDKIFSPFYRIARGKKGGYGLGLYMAKRLIESMHGSISIAPRSIGACFEIQLPNPRM